MEEKDIVETNEEEQEEVEEKVELIINDNTIILPTFKVPLTLTRDGKTSEVMITMQDLTSEKRRIATKKNFKTNIVGQSVQGDMDALGLQISTLAEAIIDAPFPTKDADIKKFPSKVIDYLYSKYTDYQKKN